MVPSRCKPIVCSILKAAPDDGLGSAKLVPNRTRVAPTQNREEALAALLEVVLTEEVVGHELKRLCARHRVVRQKAAARERVLAHDKVVRGGGVRGRGHARVEERAEGEDNEHAGEHRAVHVVLRVRLGQVVLVVDALLERLEPGEPRRSGAAVNKAREGAHMKDR